MCKLFSFQSNQGDFSVNINSVRFGAGSRTIPRTESFERVVDEVLLKHPYDTTPQIRTKVQQERPGKPMPSDTDLYIATARLEPEHTTNRKNTDTFKNNPTMETGTEWLQHRNAQRLKHAKRENAEQDLSQE